MTTVGLMTRTEPTARPETTTGAVTLTVPKHAQSGQVSRVKGKGVKRQTQQGDLYVRFAVKMPEKESSAVEKAVEALDAALDGDVREDIAF